MSDRAIIAVDQVREGQPTLRIEREVVATQAGDQQVQVDLAPLVPALTALGQQPLAPGTVGVLGQALLDVLLGHPSVPRQIDATAQDGFSFLIEDLTSAAQSLPWEALRDRNGKFIALREAPLFGRSVRHLRGPSRVDHVFQPPLRVVAVLAAAGQQPDGSTLTAEKEARAILKGLSSVLGPKFELLILGVDDDVEAFLQAENDSRVRYQELQNTFALQEALREHKPHLLHFFCHGFADEDSPPRLELALRSDQIAGFPHGSMLLEADQIVDLIDMANQQGQLLLLSLNCCLGAAATESISLARDLMKNTDLPAIIAMREAIDRRDAHSFAESFFAEARRRVGDILEEGLPATLNWASILPAIRTRLCIDRCQILSRAQDCKEWTLPVLYTRRESVNLGEIVEVNEGSHQDEEMAEIQSQLATLAKARADLAAIEGIPPSALTAIDEKIVALVQQMANLAAPSGPSPTGPDPGGSDSSGPAPSPHRGSGPSSPTRGGGSRDLPSPAPAATRSRPQPPEVRVNAWMGDAAAPAETVGQGWARWALRESAGRERPAMLDATRAFRSETARFQWQDPDVGWGVVLPDLPGASRAELAGFDDAPPAIQRLIRARKAILGRVPIFRVRQSETTSRSRVFLHDHAAGNSPAIDASDTGVAIGRIPQYLLLVGSPDEIPWDLQYVLATVRFVGRLDLDDQGLEHYVDHLLNDWVGSASHIDRSLTWAVRHNAQDITATMRSVVANPLHKLLATPEVLGAGARYLDGKVQPATAANLTANLAQHQPAVISTTSHGQTWPLDDSAAMARDLGLLVDQSEELLDPDTLLAGWQPNGAVWIAHACCSAGAKAKSDFLHLFDPETKNAKILAAVAALGNRTSPLPKALLSAPKPARAFVGQVEPTFDWTLKQNETKQHLTNRLIKPIRDRLLAGRPVGSLLESWHGRAAPLNAVWIAMREDINAGEALTPDILYPRLAAADVASTVLLGDPTAFLG